VVLKEQVKNLESQIGSVTTAYRNESYTLTSLVKSLQDQIDVMQERHNLKLKELMDE